MTNPFLQRRERAAAVANGKKKRVKVPIYVSQWYWDSVNRMFYEKLMPDYAVAESEFNDRFYCRYADARDRSRHNPAAVIKAIKNAEVHGRVWEPDNPANIIERDGLRLVNVRQNFYDALTERRSKQAA